MLFFSSFSRTPPLLVLGALASSMVALKNQEPTPSLLTTKCSTDHSLAEGVGAKPKLGSAAAD